MSAAAGVFSKRRWKQDPKAFVAIYGVDIASVIKSIESERVAVITMYQVGTVRSAAPIGHRHHLPVTAGRL